MWNHIKLRTAGRGRFPTRYVVAVMLFLSTTTGYIIRSSLSLSLLAMVNVYDENGTLIEAPDYGPRYNWSPYEQGLLLGAFFYGYTLSTMPIGLIIDQLGLGRVYILVSFAISAVLLVLSPLAASLGPFGYLFGIRVCLGLVQGGLFPNLNRMASRWAPPDEVGKFLFAGSGASMGTMLSWVVAGSIVHTWGWRYSFYVDACLVVGFMALYAYNVYDQPQLHPRIAADERAFIEQCKPSAIISNHSPSYRKLLTSPAFWIVMSLNYSYDFGFLFLVTGVPKFMNQVLGFELQSTGLLAALPFLACMCGCLCGSTIGDYIIGRKCMPLLWVRKIFLCFSHVIPGLCMVTISFVPADMPVLCIALLVIAFFCTGMITQSSYSSVHDLDPTCVASTVSIINMVTASNGFVSPLIVAYFTSERNTAAEWRYVFVMCASVYLSTALLFMLFGSATDQKWSKQRSAEDDPVCETPIVADNKGDK